jgi:hypothetical protein
MEMMFPLFSVLKASDILVPDVNVVLLHLKRRHLMEWVRAVMATTLAVKPNDPLPPILLQQETDSVYKQPYQPLEGIPANEWVRLALRIGGLSLLALLYSETDSLEKHLDRRVYVFAWIDEDSNASAPFFARRAAVDGR